ncbi:hypothetical protein LOD99_11142 [Oopsacas minuta]|uniref:Uncharacterized protein n=1 Tax=Oopsacas minuta TaxID=111878 RepID=A0AAV7KBR0_9METZ|nr:hypothetical protein LOD99_11142 [Oopsacas minuta]
MKDSYEGQEPLIFRPPQYDSLQANMEIRNSSPVTNPRLQLKYDIDDQLYRYPHVTQNVSSQNTYSPYSDRLSRQSTYPNATIDNDAPSIYFDQSPPTKRLRRTLDNSQSEEDYFIQASSHSTETGPAINTIASSSSDPGEIRIPDMVSPDMWKSKQKDYPWFFCKDVTLGCLICQKVSCLSFHKRRGVYITTELSEGLVNNYGDTKEARFEIIKPHRYRPDLVELQQLNANDLGVGLHSRYSVTEIIDHITFEMRLKICSRIQEVEGKIAIIIDESTTISNISTLVVYLKCATSKLESPEFMFLDLIELAKQDASTILGILPNCMESYGVNNIDYLSQHLIGFASAGASVCNKISKYHSLALLKPSSRVI